MGTCTSKDLPIIVTDDINETSHHKNSTTRKNAVTSPSKPKALSNKQGMSLKKFISQKNNGVKQRPAHGHGEDLSCLTEDICLQVSDESSEEDKIHLYEALYRKEWVEASSLLKSRVKPSYVDRYNRTCLHMACLKAAPLSIIKDLFHLYPEAASMRDQDGRTPLHIACEHCSDPITLLVVQNSPKNVATCKDFQYGRIPLVQAILNCRSPTCIASIIEMDPQQMLIVDHNLLPPTVIFFRMTLGHLAAYVKGKMKFPTMHADRDTEYFIQTATVILQGEADICRLEDDTQNNDNGTDENKPDNGDQSSATSVDSYDESHFLMNVSRSPACPLAVIQLFFHLYPNQIEALMQKSGYTSTSHFITKLDTELLNLQASLYRCDGCRKPCMDFKNMYFRRDPSIFYRQVLCEHCITNEQKGCYATLDGLSMDDGTSTWNIETSKSAEQNEIHIMNDKSKPDEQIDHDMMTSNKVSADDSFVTEKHDDSIALNEDSTGTDISIKEIQNEDDNTELNELTTDEASMIEKGNDDDTALNDQIEDSSLNDKKDAATNEDLLDETIDKESETGNLFHEELINTSDGDKENDTTDASNELSSNGPFDDLKGDEKTSNEQSIGKTDITDKQKGNDIALKDQSMDETCITDITSNDISMDTSI